jgi:hypothetical protein
MEWLKANWEYVTGIAGILGSIFGIFAIYTSYRIATWSYKEKVKVKWFGFFNRGSKKNNKISFFSFSNIGLRKIQLMSFGLEIPFIGEELFCNNLILFIQSKVDGEGIDLLREIEKIDSKQNAQGELDAISNFRNISSGETLLCLYKKEALISMFQKIINDYIEKKNNKLSFFDKIKLDGCLKNSKIYCCTGGVNVFNVKLIKCRNKGSFKEMEKEVFDFYKSKLKN